MTTVKQPAHLPYEVASSPTEMHDDCAEAKRNIRVPLPRGVVPARAKAPVIAVSDRLARMADAVFDRPS